MPLIVDVVVTVHNRTTYIEEMLNSIRSNIPYGSIIVMDSSTLPDSRAFVEDYVKSLKDSHVKCYRGGVAVGAKVYLGAEKATSEWLMVCSDDTIVARGYWEAVSEHLTNHNGFVAPNAYHHFASPWWKRYSEWFLVSPPVCAGSYLVRRSLVLGFSDMRDLNMSEDAYLRDYCVAKGYRFVPLRNKVAFHDPRTPNEGQQLKRAWEYGRFYANRPSTIHTLRMAKTYARAKVEQTIRFTKECEFSLPVTLFQGLLVALMICGILNIASPGDARPID